MYETFSNVPRKKDDFSKASMSQMLDLFKNLHQFVVF